MKAMKTRITTRIILLAILLSLTIVGSVKAYRVFGFWSDMSVVYDYHTLSSSWQSAISYGSSRWNGISGSGFEWAPGISGVNDIYRGSVDGSLGVFAVTTANLTDDEGNPLINGEFDWVNIKFDTSETWHTGSVAPTTSSQVDLRSVAAHEFGHALGLLHTQASNCSGSESTRPTMCAGYLPGKTWMRSIQQDDRDGVVSLYSLGAFSREAIKTTDGRRIVVHLLYEDLNMAEAIKRASLVVQGVITGISPTLWNQDNGEYWEDTSQDGTTRYVALPYFTITLSEVSDMAQHLRSDVTDLKITVLGISPLDSEGEEHFQVGKELVALARQTKLTWRKGKRPILQFVGDPMKSHFYRAQDGLFYPAELYGRGGEGFAQDGLSDLVRQLRFASEQ